MIKVEPMIRIAGVSKTFSVKDNKVEALKNVSLDIAKGDIYGIIGMSGAGKSTLLQVLDGKRRPSGGMVRLGTGARPSIFAQQQNRLGQGRVIDVIWNKYPRMTELEVRSHLAKLGFRGETVFKPCEALSGGELARLRFAELALERPNLMFLDEPTNHLDVDAKAELKRALIDFKGSVLLVSHEPEFYEDWVTSVWNIEDWTTKII